MELFGKIAIVTGGGGAGSGRATAKRLAREGVAVVIADIAQDAGVQHSRTLPRRVLRVPYHYAAKLGLPEAQHYLENCAAVSERLAEEAPRQEFAGVRTRPGWPDACSFGGTASSRR